MTTNIIPANEVSNTPVILDEFGESLKVFGRLEVSAQEPAVLAKGNLNRVDVESSGVIRGENKAIEANGVGTSITNEGTIDGGRDGIDFTNGGQASGRVTNKGTITSASRAINIGGNAVTVINEGLITTSADPRNGTVYSDVTANNYFLDNKGLIDVGQGNKGDAISWELGGEVTTSIVNSGLAQGRGVAQGTNLSSAVRLFRPDTIEEIVSFNGNIENSGLLTAEKGAAVVVQPGVRVNGSIINSGEITSANPDNGIGISFENGSELNGEILNTGLINGGRDGINFANGGQVSGVVRNKGTITSTSRAINIGGDQITVINEGLITTSADPRNGTVYSDVTANNYFLDNRGLIDVGQGNNGDAISWELGGEVTTSIVNSGLAQGRGVAQEGNLSSAVRLFRPDTIEEVVSFNGNIENSGTLTAENGATVAIQEGVQLNGFIVNTGSIEGGAFDGGKLAIDVSESANTVRVINEGTINGDVILSANNDLFDGSLGITNGKVDGGAGDDIIKGGGSNDFLAGGSGVDTLTGGPGKDSFAFIDDPFSGGEPMLNAATGINVLNRPDNITDFIIGEDNLVFEKGKLGIDQFNFQQANSGDLAGDSNLLVLLNPFANAAAAAKAVADSGVTSDEGVFVYFNTTLGFSRVVFSQDLGDGGPISVLGNLQNLTDPGVQGQFSADNFLLCLC
jgi:RTX calcium-binding nonapeptide repeat (4 copies)